MKTNHQFGLYFTTTPTGARFFVMDDFGNAVHVCHAKWFQAAEFIFSGFDSKH
jgi:hypothetical protein